MEAPILSPSVTLPTGREDRGAARFVIDPRARLRRRGVAANVHAGRGAR
ncbi:hypothetical protein [Nannocystis pusilla]